jgi:hypothetical protein
MASIIELFGVVFFFTVIILYVYFYYRHSKETSGSAQSSFQHDFNRIRRQVENETKKYGLKLANYRQPTYKELKKYHEHFEIQIGVFTPVGSFGAKKYFKALLILKNKEGQKKEHLVIFETNRINEKVKIRFKPSLAGDGKKQVHK